MAHLTLRPFERIVRKQEESEIKLEKWFCENQISWVCTRQHKDVHDDDDDDEEE